MNVNIRQLDLFCNSWLHKAKVYGRPRVSSFFRRAGRTTDVNCAEDVDTLSRCFDRFTSLFVVFNRLYTEAGKLLIQRGVVNPPARRRFAPLPDRESATEHIVTFYGEDRLKDEISGDKKCRKAVDTLVQLIRDRSFYLHEDYTTGLPDTDRDLRAANEASSYEPQAILSLIYQARCNLFHGEKDFEERQRVLLDNMSIVLEFIVLKVLTRLKEELRRP
jgi:hypothetical protein